MGQLLRVAAWLRFASQSQLTKGLEGFAKHEAPGFFEARQWAVRQLDARLCLESELPGDLSDVEAPFIEMFRAARWGYIDYFEEGNDRRQGDSRDPVKRWSCHNVPRRWWLSMASVVRGTGTYGFSKNEAITLAQGRIAFSSEKAAREASQPFALPFLTRRDFREVVIEPKVKGRTATLCAAVRGPLHERTAVLEDPLVALAHAWVERATGVVTVTAPCIDQARVWSVDRNRNSFDLQWLEIEPPNDAVAVRAKAISSTR